MSSIPDRVKPKTITLVFDASPLSMQYWRKGKDWFARNQDNVSELGYMSIRGLLFRGTKRVGLVQSGPHHHLIENQLVLAMI